MYIRRRGGGGNGYQINFLAKKFPQSVFLLIEPGYDGCRNAKKRGIQNVYNCTVENFDFKGTNVNAIGLFDVIEHIESDVTFLKKLTEITSPDTLFYITTPSYNFLWNDMDTLGGHFRRYNKDSLIALGLEAGLVPVYFSYFFSYLIIPYLIFRVIPYRLGKKTNEEDIIKAELNGHRLSKILSKVFYPIHWIESYIIKQKGIIPFGTSSIMVFKKI